MNRSERGLRRYFFELTGALALFFAFMIGRRLLHPTDPDTRIVAAILTVIPVWLIGAAVLRMFLAGDEFVRLRILNGLSISAAVTALFSMSWVLLQRDLGLPNISILWAWPVMGFTWAAVAMVQIARDGIRDKGWARAFWPTGAVNCVGIALMVCGVAARRYGGPLGVWALAAGTLVVMAMAGIAIFTQRRRP